MAANSEVSISLARGRPFMAPMTRSVKDCDNWHRSELADPLDGHMISVTVLRRDLVRLGDISCEAGLIANRMVSSPRFELCAMVRRTRQATAGSSLNRKAIMMKLMSQG